MNDDLSAKVIAREASKAGLRGKINAKCCECIYDPYSTGTWREQVQACTSKDCPLFSVRPMSSSEKGEQDD